MDLVDLPNLATAEGYDLRNQGRSMGSRKCPACGEGREGSNKLSIFRSEDKWRWKCHACSARGDAADFLAASRGISLQAALREIRKRDGRLLTNDLIKSVKNQQPDPNTSSSWISPEREKALSEVHSRYKKESYGFFISQSYICSRGVSRAVHDEAWKRGMIRAAPETPSLAARWMDQVFGKALLLQAGLLRPDAKIPAAAFRPIVGLLPGGAMEFRLNRKPSEGEVKSIRYGRLQYPWWWPQKDTKLETVLVVEGLIDLLSIKSMESQLLSPRTAIMGLPGAQSWRLDWFQRLSAANPGLRVSIALDADEAGDRMSSSMAEALAGVGIQSFRSRPPDGLDWNDILNQPNHASRIHHGSL